MMIQNQKIVKKVFKLGYRPAKPDWLIMLVDEVKEEPSTSGLILPRSVQQGMAQTKVGTVISVGGEVREVKPNDRILLGKYYGLELPHEDSDVCKLVVISEDQIDCVME